MSNNFNPAPGLPDPLSMEALQSLAQEQLSLWSRLGYVGLLLLAAMATTVVAALWITEPDLPLRTQAAFLVMTAIGLSWMAFAWWVLGRRHVMLARHGVVAGRMAVIFTALFLIGAMVAVYISVNPAAFAALWTGIVMLVVAVGLLLRANRRFAQLTERREALERELGAKM